MSDFEFSELTLTIITMARPGCAKRLIESVRRFYPRLPIVMVEQVDGPSPLSEIAAIADVQHVVLPFDTGISIARNVAVASVRTEYFILADDDFVFLESTIFTPALNFMFAFPEVAFLGGDLEERERSRADYSKARNLLFDKTGRGIVVLSAEMLKTNSKVFEGQRFQFCDLVSCWGIGRTSTFQNTPLLWDERFKIGGSHYDFFLTWKQNYPQLKIAHTSTLLCAHDPIREPQYNSLRHRQEWTTILAEKWEIDYIFVSGANIRWLSNYNHAEKPYEDDAWKGRFDKLKADNQRLRQQFQAALERINQLKRLNEVQK
jgi:hypothetical protein